MCDKLDAGAPLASVQRRSNSWKWHVSKHAIRALHQMIFTTHEVRRHVMSLLQTCQVVLCGDAMLPEDMLSLEEGRAACLGTERRQVVDG